MIGDRLYRASALERERVADRLAAILGSDPTVAFAYLFGSFADGEPFHDVDVAVYLRAAPVTFLYHVLRGRLVVCCDDDLLAQVFERTVCRYLDMAPLLRRATKEAFGA